MRDFRASLLAFGLAATGWAVSASAQFFEEKKYGNMYEEEKAWVEAQAEFPAFPKEQNLIGFQVSAASPNAFFVDAGSISPGSDGVVRFTLVVVSASGATNVSYEGIRCETRQHRLYATGRSDGTWVKARSSRWRDITGALTNRQHAALAREYFCPGGLPIRSGDEGASALRRGRHPEAIN